MDIAMDPVFHRSLLCSTTGEQSNHKSGDDLAMVNMALALPLKKFPLVI